MCVLFRCLVDIQGTKQQVRYHFAIRNNGTKSIDKNINIQKGMTHLRLPLLGSKIVIQTFRRLLFTCVLRFHASSLEGLRHKPIQLTQQREINLPAKPLANANVHRFLKPGTCCENELDVTCVCCFDALLRFRELKCRLDVIFQLGTMAQKVLIKT